VKLRQSATRLPLDCIGRPALRRAPAALAFSHPTVTSFKLSSGEMLVKYQWLVAACGVGVRAPSAVPSLRAARRRGNASVRLRGQIGSYVSVGALEAAEAPCIDAIDLARTKLERNAERDRDDVLRLAQAGLFDRHALKNRYLHELGPYLLGKHAWHDNTLELWIEMAWPSK